MINQSNFVVDGYRFWRVQWPVGHNHNSVMLVESPTGAITGWRRRSYEDGGHSVWSPVLPGMRDHIVRRVAAIIIARIEASRATPLRCGTRWAEGDGSGFGGFASGPFNLIGHNRWEFPAWYRALLRAERRNRRARNN